MAAWIQAQEASVPDTVLRLAEDVARRGSTPLLVSDGNRALGVVELKDIVKPGIQSRFAELRRMGIKTVMITATTSSQPPPSRPRPAWTTSWPKPRRKPSSS